MDQPFNQDRGAEWTMDVAWDVTGTCGLAAKAPLLSKDDATLSVQAYIFVDLVKYGVLVLVSEVWCYEIKNGQNYYYNQNLQFTSNSTPGPDAEWTMDVVGGVPTAALDGATVQINRKATALFLVHVIH